MKDNSETTRDESIRVWDLPLRLFHWALAILVSISIYTGVQGGFTEMDYHMLSGYCILALVLFRIIWGVIGSRHSRFVSFISLKALLPYTRTLLSGGSRSTGHNPLGALSVIAMLLLLGIQASTGLFANDDIFLEGPLAHLVDDTTSDRLTTVHHTCAKILYGLIALHLIAIAFYETYRRERLILPMITGNKKIQPRVQDTPSPLREAATALAALVLCAGFVYWLINYL